MIPSPTTPPAAKPPAPLALLAPKSPAPLALPAPKATALVNILIGAAADPEAMVRASAVWSLGILGDPRSLPPLAARLIDRSRVVRVQAAEALLNAGIVSLDGAAGAALARAQEEYATSLRTFSDSAGDHTSLAWLELSRGRTADAAHALELAQRLDPGDLRARVYRGVIAARDGRFSDALREWRAVREANPQYPNIDRLIAEAEKRIP